MLYEVITSTSVRERVMKARKIQQERFKDDESIHCNAQMTNRLLSKHAQPNDEGLNILKTAMEKLDLSARAYDRILKVSRTIADLEECHDTQAHHIAEAVQYRSLDRSSWGS